MLIASYLPSKTLHNKDLSALGWPSEKIYSKTGIQQRHIADSNESALMLAHKASENLLETHGIDKNSIDYLIYCTQSPDRLLPNNASELQRLLGLKTSLGSFDFNQGCTGFVYGLSIAKGLLKSSQAERVLLVTAETYSKYIRDDNRACRSIFGDAGCAALLDTKDANNLGDFVFGTDGKGAEYLCVQNNRVQYPNCPAELDTLYMNGPEIFSFTIDKVPKLLTETLEREQLKLEHIDHFVFHQANKYMLEHLRKKMKIDQDKFHYSLENTGNTVSCSIPIVLEQLQKNKSLRVGQNVLLVAFGLGYSWIAVKWKV